MPPVIRRCQISLLLFCNISWLLLPASCTTFQNLGSLTVSPSVPFLMGSNLTLHCHVHECPHPSNIYLEIEKKIENKIEPKIVWAWKLGNCRATFTLTNVQEPLFTAYCKKNYHGVDYYVTGTTLRSGRPPDKPQNVCCETTRNAHFVECKWNKGRNPFVPTTYNISLHRENGSLIYSTQAEDKENCSVPREIFDKNTKYQLTIVVHNHFGQSRSDPFMFSLQDVVIPELPHITQIDFRNVTLAAILQWKVNESSKDLKPFIRMRSANSQWKEEDASEIGEGLVQVAVLRPLTDYEFQLKTCSKAFQQNNTNPSDGKAVCSKWSPSFWKKSPDKGPTQPLRVWRDSVMKLERGQYSVTVFWKPLSLDDYSGQVHDYEIFYGNGQKQKEVCSPMSPQCTARVPLLPPISVSAVTSNWLSPPAPVPLTQTDAPGAILREGTPTVNGSGVVVSWASPKKEEETLSYVVEWTTLPPTTLHWKTLSKQQRDSTVVTGLEPGVRYNISLYTVTTGGVSAPSSSLVYYKEQKPTCGPVMSVLVHEFNKVLVKWDEVPLEHRRGFITSYTIYCYVLNLSSSQLTVDVPATDPRQRWLDCPEGTLGLQMTASTSAGEGPRGNLISSHPPAPPVGLVIVIVFIITVFIAIIINLMCWKCVRKRIKQKCISWGPEWLRENSPELKNSNAIKLLKLDRSDPSLFSSYNDPPLSPISFLSQDEREDLYPCVHVESGPDTTLLVSESTPTEICISGVTVEHGGYKPQTTTFTFPQKEEVKEVEDEHTSSDLLEEFHGGLLLHVQVDQSDSETRLGLDAVHRPCWSKPTETNLASRDKWISSDKMDTKSKRDLLLIQNDEISPDEAFVDLSEDCVETVVSGYFPQVTSPLSPT